jgi:hypothetical protein
MLFSKNLNKDNTNVSIIQYIYINMFKKRFLYEQEEEVELNDFQKILALNKRRIHPSDIDFETSDGKDFSDVIDIDYDGIHFKFDGLEEFLKFFFPQEHEEGSDGEYDAINYDMMYRGQWDWYDEYYNRSYDDWREGYIVSAFKSESLKRLKEILNIVSPNISKVIVEKEGRYSIVSETGESQITSILTTLGVDDEIQNAFVEAQVAAVSGEAPDYIEKTYCNCLTDVGIENYSERHCFWRYIMDWGSAILLFARFGTENDKFLDLLFEAISKTNVSHLPEYYEIAHYVWNEESFTNTYVPELDRIFDRLLERIEEDETYTKEYLEVLDKVSKIGGVGEWIRSENGKFKIMINKIDPETLKIDFNVSNRNNYISKKGRSTIDEIINLLNNESLFGPEEFREHYLKFLQKTVL